MDTRREQRVVVRSEEMQLYAEKAVFWLAKRWLMVADLHWGKAEVFQAHGMGLPSSILDFDLKKLGSLIDKTRAERLVVLGDLVHHQRGLTPAVKERIALWRQQYPLPFVLIKGNHDRSLTVSPDGWNIDICEKALVEGPFVMAHEPLPRSEGFVWAGHTHPVITLRGRGDRLRLPCFQIGRDVGILPSFSAFTGGAEIQRAFSDQVVAVADDELVALDG